MKDQQIKAGKLLRNIRRGVKTAENYGSGFAYEKVIVASYKTLSIKQLEGLRYIMNQIIKKKKLDKRISESNDTPSIGQAGKR